MVLVFPTLLQDSDKPMCMYASVGHTVSLNTAKEWALKLSPKYHLPEPNRQTIQQLNRALQHKDALCSQRQTGRGLGTLKIAEPDNTGSASI
ncbi:endonuclease V [Pseudoalteromonas viridis]|uniref:endonuclease V n=1 Tax=Pseudoalteromonas viridis TaxID=339617 RepID=UPI0024692C57|nr:endonuclease V [Pseudoalteromonas viridis]